MAAIMAYWGGIKNLFREKRMWLFFYGLLFVFGLLMILPIHGMILEHLGFPLDIGRDLGKFDYTQVADLLNNHGEALGIIFYQAKWIFLFYVLLTVLMNSGIVTYYYFRKTNFSFSDFIKDALKYFWKFFRLTVYALLFHAALLAIAIFAYQKILGSFSPFEIEDDSKLVSGFWTVVPIFLFCAFIIQIIADVAKFKIIQSSNRFITSGIIAAFKAVFKNFFTILLFFLLQLVVFYVGLKSYHFLKSIFSLEGTFGFWILIVLGQLYILFRVGLRLVKFSGLGILLREHRI